MVSTFDPFDRRVWYFGQMSRTDATDLLMREKEGGAFLVRKSTSLSGEYVLSVKEESKVSHYLINNIHEGGKTKYQIGGQLFPDLPSILIFYKVHYLNKTPLLKAAPKRLGKVKGLYDFEGKDPEDLPFKKGEILLIISKDEDQWWTARNSMGRAGFIPVPYVQKLKEKHSRRLRNCSGSEKVMLSSSESCKMTVFERKLPALARVKQARVPNAYDKTALHLKLGEIITVTKMNLNGQWEGEWNGKYGHFPFNFVEFLDNQNNQRELIYNTAKN